LINDQFINLIYDVIAAGEGLTLIIFNATRHTAKDLFKYFSSLCMYLSRLEEVTGVQKLELRSKLATV
jgi:hypothetical protein